MINIILWSLFCEVLHLQFLAHELARVSFIVV